MVSAVESSLIPLYPPTPLSVCRSLSLVVFAPRPHVPPYIPRLFSLYIPAPSFSLAPFASPPLTSNGGEQAELVRPLVGFPAIWMACGNSHSVVVGGNGVAMAFGLNNHGQVLRDLVLVLVWVGSG